MRTCPNCGEENEEAATRCRRCGSTLSPDGFPTLPPPPAGPTDDEPLQYTHSGQRYLLGYGSTFFGIWDRQQPGPPVSRYPRTNEGWREAWLAFTAREPASTDVGMTAAGPPAYQSPVAPMPLRRQRVSGAWWLLPIFMGWLGGLIAYLVNKDIDPNVARSMLWTGIVISAALFLLVVAAAR